jgi:hypothetical protein
VLYDTTDDLGYITNTGMRLNKKVDLFASNNGNANSGAMQSYSLLRKGLSSMYIKRRIHSNLISSSPWNI